MSRRKGSNNNEVHGQLYLSIAAADERDFAGHVENTRKNNGRQCACCGGKISGGGLKANGAVYCSKSCFLMMAAH